MRILLERMQSELHAQSQPVPHNPLPVQYYADSQAVDDLARGANIYIGDFELQVSQSLSQSVTKSVEMQGGLSPFFLGKKGHSEEGSQSGETRVVMNESAASIQVVREVVEKLSARGQLRTDLLDFPEATQGERNLLAALEQVRHQWNVSVRPDGPDDREEAEKLALDLDRYVTASVDLLALFAVRRTQRQVDNKFQQIDRNGELAWVEETWSICSEPDGGMHMALPPACDLGIMSEVIPSNSLQPLTVPLPDQSQLTDQGKAQLQVGTRVWAGVLGTVVFEPAPKDDLVGSARVAPIAIIGDLGRRSPD